MTYPDSSRVRHSLLHDQLQESRLAYSVLTYYADLLSFFYIHIHMVE